MMKSKMSICSMMFVMITTLTSCASTASAQSARSTQSTAQAQASAQVASTDPADRSAVELTIYNADLGLVKETRTVTLQSGENELRFIGVPALINPVTVHVRPLGRNADFAILEQNYAYDLISHAKLMEKYVGREIRIMNINQFQDRRENVTAEVLSAADGGVYRIGDSIYLGHPGIRIVPEIPGNLISRPTLSWIYRSRRGGEQAVEVSYLTGGMSWSADYILALGAGREQSGLSGWVTVNNTSGADFENATLKLVAGNVNRVRQEVFGRRERAVMAMSAEADMAGAGFEQTAMFEYYMYDLQRNTSVLNNQTKQINLLNSQNVNVSQEYITTAAQFMQPRHDGGARVAGDPVRQAVSAFATFRNSEQNGLGNALPAGIVRVYAADAGGSRQFIGEDRVAHTPRNEDVRLRLGEAFDIVAERTQVSYRQLSAQQHEMEWQITLRNRKNERVTVGVVEQAHGTWEIVESSHNHRRLDASTFRFDIPVNANGEATVRYKIRVGI